MSKVHHSFDLFDYVNAIMSPEVAAQVAQSVAWRIDTMSISAARQLFKDIREDQVNAGIDSLAELTLAMNKQAYSEQVFHEYGSIHTGPICLIKELAYVSEAWHAAAARLTSLTFDWKGVPKVYTQRSIEDQIFNPGTIKIAGESKARMRVSAERKANLFGMPEAVDKLYANNLARSEQRAADTVENIKSMAQGVFHMYALAVAHPMQDPSGATTTEFMSLSLETQRVLINAAMTAAERAESWATNDRNLSDNDYDLISLSAFKAMKELGAELKHPRFIAAAAQQQAGEHMTG